MGLLTSITAQKGLYMKLFEFFDSSTRVGRVCVVGEMWVNDSVTK